MKIFLASLAVLILLLASGCQKDTQTSEYMFVKPYCAKVTVGGVVGISDKCFSVGEVFPGKIVSQGMIRIRFLPHSSVNDGPPSNASYQEELDIPVEYLTLH